MSSRKRKRAQLARDDDEEHAGFGNQKHQADEAEATFDPLEKESDVWDSIREERYEIVEQLPLTLHRQLSLMRQLDEQSQGYVAKLLPTLRNYIDIRRDLLKKEEGTSHSDPKTSDVAMATPNTDASSSVKSNEIDRTAFSFNEATTMPIPRERTRAPQTSREHLSHIAWLSEELLRASQEKVNLAQATTDSVDRHIRLLDVAIQEQEASLLSSAQGSIHLPDLTLPKPTRQSGNVFEKYNSITLQTSVLLNDSPDEEITDSPVDEVGIPRDIMRALFISPTKNSADEELYCYCNRVSFGEMIACDGPQCSLEWFHLGCVGLTETPPGEWFCENCTTFKM